jgi:D-glycero-D-manno-heptose 1,7-bisphosphate phosphatase
VTIPAATNRPAVFLDRDGTLIEEVGYLDRPDRVILYPWSTDAIRAQPRRRRHRHGHEPVGDRPRVLHGSGCGSRPPPNRRSACGAGAHLDAYYYCPHHPHGSVREHTARATAASPGAPRGSGGRGTAWIRSLVHASAIRWLKTAELARRVGARGVLVRTGYGAAEEHRPSAGVTADAIVNNLVEAASWILERVAKA